jgi:Domain of unknown function (DUF1902)
MTRSISIAARWDADASIWLASSTDVPGLVIEAQTWPDMIDEVRLVLPELLALSGHEEKQLSVTFRIEEHLDINGT